MLIISSREFRQNQKNYLNLVDNNEQVIVTRGKNKSYKILPVKNDDICMTEDEYFAKLDESIQQAEEGKTTVLTQDKQKELLAL